MKRIDNGHQITLQKQPLDESSKENNPQNGLVITKEIHGYLYHKSGIKSKHVYRMLHCKKRKQEKIDQKTLNIARLSISNMLVKRWIRL